MGLSKCNQEVGAKNVGNTKRYQPASCEPMPPLANKVGELGSNFLSTCDVYQN